MKAFYRYLKIRNKKVLVTGGAGFIGSHLVDLLAKNNSITVFDDLSSGMIENLEQYRDDNQIKFIREDVKDQQAVNEAMKGIDVVFHLAVRNLRISLSDPMQVHEVNATGTLHVCKSAIQNNVERFVYMSSSEVYGPAAYFPMDEKHSLNPTTPYGASKLAGEKYARSFYHTYGLPTVIVRPFNAYGPRSHFEGAYGEVIPRFVIRGLNGKGPVIFGTGNNTRDFTYVTDTVKGILLAAESDKLLGEEINIAQGKETSVKELADIILEILDRKDLEVKYLKTRPGDISRQIADISKAKKYLNYEPQVSIKEGVKMYVEWVKTQPVDMTKITEINW